MLTEHDSLLVTLDSSEEPKTLAYDGRKYGLLPGTAVHVPFEVVRLHFGDPRSGPANVTALSEDGQTKIMIRSRADEVRRLETLYGVNAELLRRQIESRATGAPVVAPRLSEVAPKVTVTTVTGEPVTTVLEDPAGEQAAPISIAADDTQAIGAQVAQMQEQLDKLLAQQRALEEQPEAGEEVTEDTPRGRASA